MWIQRTPEETAKWHAATIREAKTHGLLVAIVSWLVITALLAAGAGMASAWGASMQSAVTGGSFWSRFPIFAVMGLPVAYWLFRRETQRELDQRTQMTICPKCETASNFNADALCECGSQFVLQSSVRWVDEPESQKNENAG